VGKHIKTTFRLCFWMKYCHNDEDDIHKNEDDEEDYGGETQFMDDIEEDDPNNKCQTLCYNYYMSMN
jgi:hypothetical protein